MSDIFFTDLNTGYICSLQGNLLKTTNAGSNWILANSFAGAFRTICFINSNTGYGAGLWDGEAMCKRTTNGGVNWINMDAGTNNAAYNMAFTDLNTGYILGAGAMILKTTNGGAITNVQPINNIIPSEFSLFQNYPNPFNPSTKIKFQIPVTPLSFGEGLGVRLILYDNLGRQIETLVNQQLPPGIYEVDWNAAGYSSGVYYYRLSSGIFSETKKLILIK